MRSTTFLIFLLLARSLYSQSLSDSLSKELSVLPKNGVSYVQLLTQIAKQYSETMPDSALLIGREAMTIAQDQNFDSLKSQILVAFSTSYSFLGQYDSAMKYSFLALRKSEEYRDTITMIDAYNNIGIDHMYREEDEKSIEYFMKVEVLSRLYGDSLRLGHALNNIGMMYGLAERMDIELDYYEKAASIFLKINEKQGYANTLLNMGTVFTMNNEFEKAENYYQKAISVFEQFDFTSGIQNSLQSWAENAMKEGQMEKARDLANQALQIAQEHSLNQDIAYTYDLLEKIALENEDYKTAYQFEIKESEIREELFTKEKAKQIDELETMYETEKKQAEINRLSLENELKDSRLLGGGIVGGLVIILLIVFFTLRSKKQRAEKEAQELQIEAMKKRFMELHSSPAELAVELDFEELNTKLNTPLTEREFESLKLSIEGKTNTEIGEILFISVSTVKFHLRNTYSKMGVGNRKEAFQYMLKTS